MALTQLSSYTLTYPLAQPFGTAPIGACSSLCKLSLEREKNALILAKSCTKINEFDLIYEKMPYRMVYIICALHEPITVQVRQGMERVDFLEKTRAARALAIYMNYLSMLALVKSPKSKQ